MIESTLGYLGFILLVTTLIVYSYQKYAGRFAAYIPLVLVIYVIFMLSINSALLHPKEETLVQAKLLLSNLLPAMIFLMMLQFRIDLFRVLGSRMILGYFATTLSIILAFVTIFYLFQNQLFTDAGKSFASLAGSWSGGTVNMIAVAHAVDLDAAKLGSVIAVDAILYSFWVVLLLALVPFATKFNRFTKAKSANYLDVFTDSCPIQSDTPNYVRIILLSIILAFVVNIAAELLPRSSFLSPAFYSIILATVLGVIASFTQLRHLVGTHSVAQSMLYLIIALIASQAQIQTMGNIGSFLIFGTLILLFHMIFMIGVAKIFRLDLFTIGLASLAHMGGIASAPILASAYHRSLIPVGVAMATMGYLIGTVVGLFIAYLLGAI